MPGRIWNTRTDQNRIDFSFALVVEEVANLRNSTVALLRERDWLVKCAGAGANGDCVLLSSDTGGLLHDLHLATQRV